MPRTVDDYPDIVEISKSVILELWRCLHKYNDAMTLIGGWAPYFIMDSKFSKRTRRRYQRTKIN